MVNVEGDSIGAGIIAHLSRDQLRTQSSEAYATSNLSHGSHHDNEHNEIRPPPTYNNIDRKTGRDNKGFAGEQDDIQSTGL